MPEFGKIIQAEFEAHENSEAEKKMATMKVKEAYEPREFILGIEYSERHTIVVRIIEAHVHYFKGQRRSMSAQTFNPAVETFNPDQIISYKRIV